MKALTILKRARKLLSKPERWTKGDYAFDKHGNLVNAESKKAVCWCAAGACERYSPPNRSSMFVSNYSTPFLDAIQALELAIPLRSEAYTVAEYNDGRLSHANLLKWFDRAIAKLEASK